MSISMIAPVSVSLSFSTLVILLSMYSENGIGLPILIENGNVNAAISFEISVMI